jgi:hypothetical protein
VAGGQGADLEPERGTKPLLEEDQEPKPGGGFEAGVEGQGGQVMAVLQE